MNKELAKKIEEEANNYIRNQALINKPKNLHDIHYGKECYLAGTNSSAMLDYIIERTVELARSSMKSGIRKMPLPLDEMKSIIKQEVK
jgi:hypothetical protein